MEPGIDAHRTAITMMVYGQGITVMPRRSSAQRNLMDAREAKTSGNAYLIYPWSNVRASEDQLLDIGVWCRLDFFSEPVFGVGSRGSEK
jgi:hypothetical protein